jgi:hypothetical protein
MHKFIAKHVKNTLKGSKILCSSTFSFIYIQNHCVLNVLQFFKNQQLYYGNNIILLLIRFMKILFNLTFKLNPLKLIDLFVTDSFVK